MSSIYSLRRCLSRTKLSHSISGLLSVFSRKNMRKRTCFDSISIGKYRDKNIIHYRWNSSLICRGYLPVAFCKSSLLDNAFELRSSFFSFRSPCDLSWHSQKQIFNTAALFEIILLINYMINYLNLILDRSNRINAVMGWWSTPND